MFQTFSGSSRRPRQVNLSGQNTNPFAASSWTPTASGTQQTVAHAQQERQQRQQERQRLNATKQIQRTWRGHKVRRELADLRRAGWDKVEAKDCSSECGVTEQLRLLVLFFTARKRDDLERLERLSQRISSVGYDVFLSRVETQPRIASLANITLAALKALLPESQDSLLQLLTAIVDSHLEIFPRISQQYYSYISALLVNEDYGMLNKPLVLKAIRVPLTERIELEQSDELILDSYAIFALQLLTTPRLGDLLDGLTDLAPIINVGRLSTALVRKLSSSSAENNTISPKGRLWLLAHFIALHRLQQGSSHEPEFVRALSFQLSSCSGAIIGRLESSDPEIVEESSELDSPNNAVTAPLPSLIKNELLTLVNEESIRGILDKFDVDQRNASVSAEEDASLLASYALTLLRLFPQRSDNIRMWLFGSTTSSSGTQVPALIFFWQAMTLNHTFAAISHDSKAALTILRAQARHSSSNGDFARDREWRTILLFLEIYTFALRFIDDEEFLSAGNSAFGTHTGPVTRIQKSALPIEDVKQLTLFLKNLAFTMYYNASELSDDDSHSLEGGLGNYFGTTTISRFQSHEAKATSKPVSPTPFAGVAGMTLDYVKTLVTGVIRMLYERDSRRRFLPKNHWLMTSRFDMEGFIPAVVMEEERQHEVAEEGEDGGDVDDMDMEMEDDLPIVGMARPRRAQQLESLRRQQQRTARKKVLAAVGPRLEVLQNMPFAIPFDTRVQIFRQFVHLDQTRRRGGQVDPDIWRMSMVQNAMMQNGPHHRDGREALGRHHAKIRRDNIFNDAFEHFYELGEGLKEPIQITFVDQFDTVEAGIDGGGVTKEFLTSVTNEAFRSETNGPNLFVTNDQNLLYPDPVALDGRQGMLRQANIDEQNPLWRETTTEVLKQYEFLGRVIGKCLYEGILVDVGFAAFFLRKWASAESGYRANINDLRDLDESLYQGLLKLKNYPGNVEDFSLDFTINDVVSMPQTQLQTITRDLMPNGSNTPVTNENRPLYVYYVARHRLQIQPYRQTQAFLRGLGEIIKPSWLSMFNQSELQTLLGGDSSEIDVEDLRMNTAYGGVYQIGDDGLEHSTVRLFWKVLKELNDQDRRKVLKYVTSTPRAPLLGFSQLNPRFSIRDAGSDEERLPSTSTCVNLLKLPRYSSAAILKSKLLYAVNSGAGFDLS